MDIKLEKDNNRFLYRVSALIYNKDLSKVLLFKVENRNWYMLTGGKIQFNENSEQAIKREIKEELGYEVSDLSLVAVDEEFVQAKDYNNHQLNLIYKGVYNGDIDKLEFGGLDGDWAIYKWINISEINNYDIFPGVVKDIVKNPNQIYHNVTNK